ncbi:MAG: hypothetical protein ACRD4K_04185 [Candidatus Acidiferrales bacterium]
MDHSDKNDPALCAIFFDLGTTNTRAWLTLGNRFMDPASRPAGVRDTAPFSSWSAHAKLPVRSVR